MSEPRDIQLKRLLSEGAITREQFEELRSSLPEHRETNDGETPVQIAEAPVPRKTPSLLAAAPWQIIAFLMFLIVSGLMGCSEFGSFGFLGLLASAGLVLVLLKRNKWALHLATAYSLLMIIFRLRLIKERPAVIFTILLNIIALGFLYSVYSSYSAQTRKPSQQ